MKPWHVQSNPAEVTPIDDIRTHHPGTDCWCQPYKVDDVIVHNALDAREVHEKWRECTCANEDGDEQLFGHSVTCPLYSRDN